VIFYAPETPITREIMEDVEDKFAKLKGVEHSLASIVNVVHRIRKFMRSNSDEIANVLVLTLPNV